MCVHVCLEHMVGCIYINHDIDEPHETLLLAVVLRFQCVALCLV